MDLAIVMNAQNSFLKEGSSVYMGEKAEILKVRIGSFLSGYNKRVVFIREKHAMSDDFFVNDKTHSIATTDDIKIVSELKKYANIFYDKVKYSAFYKTKFQSFLAREKVRHIGIMGVETHTSILFTVEGLRNRGYDVTLIEPCCMSRDDFMHDNAVTLMRNFLGVRIGG